MKATSNANVFEEMKRPFVETASLHVVLVQMMQNLLVSKDICVVGARGKIFTSYLLTIMYT